MKQIKSMILLAIALMAAMSARAQNHLILQYMLEPEYYRWYTYNYNRPENMRVKYIFETMYHYNKDGSKDKLSNLYSYDGVEFKKKTELSYEKGYNFPISTSTYFYYGQTLQLMTFNKWGSHPMRFIYDNANRITMIYEESLYSDNYGLQMLFTYDDNNVIKSITKVESGSNRPITVTLSPDGNTLTISENRYGDITYVTTFKKEGKRWVYTEFNNATDIYTYNKDCNPVKIVSANLTVIWTYDSNGDCIKMEDFDSTGARINLVEYEYEYDDKGNWIKMYAITKGERKLTNERQIIYW